MVAIMQGNASMGVTGCPRVKHLLLATTPEEFENGCFKLKTHQTFWRNITDHFGFVT